MSSGSARDGGRDGAQRIGGAVVSWGAGEDPACRSLPASCPRQSDEQGRLMADLGKIGQYFSERIRRRSVLRESWGECDRLPVFSDLGTRLVSQTRLLKLSVRKECVRWRVIQEPFRYFLGE